MILNSAYFHRRNKIKCKNVLYFQTTLIRIKNRLTPEIQTWACIQLVIYQHTVGERPTTVFTKPLK